MKKYILLCCLSLLIFSCDSNETVFHNKLQFGKQASLSGLDLIDGDSTKFSMGIAEDTMILWTRIETQYDQQQSDIELNLARVNTSGTVLSDTIIIIPYEPAYSAPNVRMWPIRISEIGKYHGVARIIFESGPRDIDMKDFTIYKGLPPQ